MIFLVIDEHNGVVRGKRPSIPSAKVFDAYSHIRDETGCEEDADGYVYCSRLFWKEFRARLEIIGFLVVPVDEVFADGCDPFARYWAHRPVEWGGE